MYKNQKNENFLTLLLSAPNGRLMIKTINATTTTRKICSVKTLKFKWAKVMNLIIS